MKKVIPVIFVLAVLSIGCKLSNLLQGSGGGSNSTSSASGGAVQSSDPKADIVATSRKFIDLKSFTAKMEGEGTTPIMSQVEYAAPDRFHVSYLGGTGAGTELIYVGDESFMKSGGGKWTKMPGGGANPMTTLRASFTEEGLKTLTDVKFEGEDTVDGKPALVYSYKNVTPVGASPFTAKMWVSKSTGVPMKIYAEYSNGVLKNMTVNYDTDSPVNIEAPIK
jgi:outer membrane lipoprotein-sorting protein